MNKVDSFEQARLHDVGDNRNFILEELESMSLTGRGVLYQTDNPPRCIRND